MPFFSGLDKVDEDATAVLVPDGCRLAACADMDSARWVCGCVQVVPASDGECYLCATDGYQFTIVRCQSRRVAGKFLLPKDALPKKKNSCLITVKGSRWENSEGCFGEMPGEEGRFPLLADFLPNVDDMSSGIGLNFHLLNKALGALHQDRYMMLLSGAPDRPVLVDGVDGFSVVNPCRADIGKAIGKIKEKLEKFKASYGRLDDEG